jgi:hypothetical protein
VRGDTSEPDCTSPVLRISTPCSIFWVKLIFSVYGKGNETIFKNKEILNKMRNVKLLDYFTHFIIRQFEDLSIDKQNPKRFRVEILFSAGCKNGTEHMNWKEHQRPLENYITIHDQLCLQVFLDFIEMNIQNDINELNQKMQKLNG